MFHPEIAKSSSPTWDSPQQGTESTMPLPISQCMFTIFWFTVHNLVLTYEKSMVPRNSWKLSRELLNPVTTKMVGDLANVTMP